MTRPPPPPADSLPCLGTVLDRVEAAVSDLDFQRPDLRVYGGLWAAWLRWVLQLLAFEIAVAWGDPGLESDVSRDGFDPWSESWPQAADLAAPARPLPARVLDRKINRLLAAAAHLRTFGRLPAAKPPRRLRRRPMLRAFSGIGARGWRSRRAPLTTTGGLLGARVLALCKP
jgi:hypothetical protein